MSDVKHYNLFRERFLVAPQYRLWRHFLLAAVILLATFWEMKDIYMEGSRWFPVLKSSVICLLVIYFNIYILAPYFLVKRRWYWVYLLTVLYVAMMVFFAENWFNNGDTDGVCVPPLLFIPFVENAVKHNPGSDDYLPYVKVLFRLNDRKLYFTCVNSKPATMPENNEQEGGLGLANVRRRLSLLYPDKHFLNITTETDKFQVDLQIPY